MSLMVKITVNDDGDRVEKPVWCAVTFTDGRRTLCSGEVYGIGESGVEYKEKDKGKITCPRCIDMIKDLKEYKF